MSIMSLKSKKSLLLLIAALSSLLIFAGCGEEEQENETEEVIEVPVTTETVTQGNLREHFLTIGNIEAVDQASVSAKISGRAANINVSLGDYVTKGQVLATIEESDYLNSLNNAKASLVQAESNLANTSANYERNKKLYEQQVISQQSFDASKTSYEVCVSQVNQAKIAVAIAEETYRNTKIIAPISGQIGSRNINRGEMISAGTPLFTIVDLSNVYVTINLSDSYIHQTKKGQTAQVALASNPGVFYNGKVAQISPSAGNNQTFTVKLLMNNSNKDFRDGMLAEVTMFFNEKANVLSVPIDSVIDEGSSKAVFVIENGAAARKIVTTGISDGKYTEIVEGLTADAVVVTLGQENLQDGTKVVVK